LQEGRQWRQQDLKIMLITTQDNVPPAGAEASLLETSDGLRLRIARWDAVNRKNCLGTIVVFGGRAEFIEKYFEVVGELLERRFAVVALDWRGQGGSARELENPRKGHVDDFALYERDVAALRAYLEEERCPPPIYALAHSMGAAILLNLARRGELSFVERMVLTAPMIDIHGLRHPSFARWLAEGLDILGFGTAFIPGGGETSVSTKRFDGNVLTSDQRRYGRAAAVIAAAPQLGLGDPTIGWVNSAFRAMAQFADPEFARRTLTPILVIASGADRVVDTPAAERFSSRLKAGRVLVVPHARHEIMMERDPFRQQFWAAFDAFIPGTRDELARLLAKQKIQVGVV
jgi:lysophospholipase